MKPLLLLALVLTGMVAAQSIVITAPEPVTVAPVAAKTYPHLWISRLRVAAPTVGTGSVTIELLPYNQQTQEIGPAANLLTVQTDELFLAVNEVPEVAQAFGAILNSVEPLRQWTEKRKASKAAAGQQGQ